jgi:signal peptide peptidase SppA
MKIIDILTSPWAIVPEKLYEIREIYATHLRGEKIDLAVLQAQAGKGSGEEDEPYDVIEGIAIIPIQGVIAKKMNLFSRISGGVSTQLTGRDIRDALSRQDVRGILLDIDSPGGTVDGTQELAQTVFDARNIKPIIAYTDGSMTSAAYWIGSAALEVLISGDTNRIGSIGVVAAHVDYSEYERKIGIKTTEVYAGKYKRIYSSYKPLSEEGNQSIQDEVDYVYSVFVDTVATHRGVTSEEVLANMADGRIFLGRQAVRAGLVDGVSTFDRAIERLTVLQSQMEEAERLRNLNNQLRGR